MDDKDTDAILEVGDELIWRNDILRLSIVHFHNHFSENNFNIRRDARREGSVCTQLKILTYLCCKSKSTT